MRHHIVAYLKHRYPCNMRSIFFQKKLFFLYKETYGCKIRDIFSAFVLTMKRKKKNGKKVHQLRQLFEHPQEYYKSILYFSLFSKKQKFYQTENKEQNIIKRNHKSDRYKELKNKKWKNKERKRQEASNCKFRGKTTRQWEGKGSINPYTAPSKEKQGVILALAWNNLQDSG